MYKEICHNKVIKKRQIRTTNVHAMISITYSKCTDLKCTIHTNFQLKVYGTYVHYYKQ